jgi:putative sterol carrier protein
MATIEECREALNRLAKKLAEGAAGGRPPSLDRTLSCYLTDLDAGFRGRLVDGELRDITEGHDPSAKIKLSATSDDFVALTQGDLNFASAWASNRLKVDASVFDLLKLRSLL